MLIGLVSFAMLGGIFLASIYTESDFITPLFFLFFVFVAVGPMIQSWFNEKVTVVVENNTVIIRGAEEKRLEVTEKMKIYTPSAKGWGMKAVGIRDGEQHSILQFSDVNEKMRFLQEVTNVQQKMRPWTTAEKIVANQIDVTATTEEGIQIKNLNLSSLGEALGRFTQVQKQSSPIKQSSSAPAPNINPAVEEDRLPLMRIVVAIIFGVVVYVLFQIIR